jgi:hypothetical protein
VSLTSLETSNFELSSSSTGEDVAKVLLSIKKTSNAKLMLKFLDKKTKQELTELVKSLVEGPIGSEMVYSLNAEFM